MLAVPQSSGPGNSGPSRTDVMTYKFRSASLLDVPLIFDLMMEGSEAGVFATRFSSGSGAVFLLWYILKGISAMTYRLSGRERPSAWKIIFFEARPIGFFATTARAQGHPGLHLLFYSIKADSRHRGHGKSALKQLIEQQARGSILTVSCTKYAVCMQHILKKQHFQRDRRGGFLLEHYSVLHQPEAVSEPGDKQPRAKQHRMT
jgi:hypothetical protein